MNAEAGAAAEATHLEEQSGEDSGVFCLLAGREPLEEVAREAKVLEQVPLLAETLNAMPYMVMVLNPRRQIVAANEALLRLLGTAASAVSGRRPGEAMGCLWSTEGSEGCGTGKHCAACGAVQAVLESGRSNQRVVRECRILTGKEGETTALDLRVTATPFRVGNERYILLAAEDISQSKRLSVLQRTFFHDVLNTAGCIQGYLRFLDRDGSSRQDVQQRLGKLTVQIVTEIQAQRDLLAAEAGEYQLQSVPLRTSELLDELCVQYQGHTAAADRTITITSCSDQVIVSDKRLLLRVLGNMVKNALEASNQGDTVSVACTRNDENVTFTVHNATVMPEEVQLQVFQRSFSTKAQSGRGIGTYSMKLFGETYLAGKVGFTSTPSEGTTFYLSIPKELRVSRE